MNTEGKVEKLVETYHGCEVLRVVIDPQAKTAEIYRATGELAGTWDDKVAQERHETFKAHSNGLLVCVAGHEDIAWIYPHTLYGEIAGKCASAITSVVYVEEARHNRRLQRERTAQRPRKLKVSQIHLDFWESKQSKPAWAPAVKRATSSTVSLVDSCINAQANVSATESERAISNLAALCRGHIGRRGSLLNFLRRVAVEPGCVINPKKRAATAKRWAAKLARLSGEG
jgi:hypothetical protein